MKLARKESVQGKLGDTFQGKGRSIRLPLLPIDLKRYFHKLRYPQASLKAKASHNDVQDIATKTSEISLAAKSPAGGSQGLVGLVALKENEAILSF